LVSPDISARATKLTPNEIRRRQLPLPNKLYSVLTECPDFEGIVSWSRNGRAWKILKPGAFKEQVLKVFLDSFYVEAFQVNGLPGPTSVSLFGLFLQLLDMWGFQEVDDSLFHHPLFHRDEPHLIHSMKASMKSRKLNLTTLHDKRFTPSQHQAPNSSLIPASLVRFSSDRFVNAPPPLMTSEVSRDPQSGIVQNPEHLQPKPSVSAMMQKSLAKLAFSSISPPPPGTRIVSIDLSKGKPKKRKWLPPLGPAESKKTKSLPTSSAWIGNNAEIFAKVKSAAP
jgi:hypothetical protein